MLKVENYITGHQHTHPWSPELHDDVRTVSLWKTVLTQFRTKIYHQRQVKVMLQSMNKIIDINWSHSSDIKKNLKKLILNIKRTKKSAVELRIKHLIERASVMNLVNKSIEF